MILQERPLQSLHLVNSCVILRNTRSHSILLLHACISFSPTRHSRREPQIALDCAVVSMMSTRAQRRGISPLTGDLLRDISTIVPRTSPPVETWLLGIIILLGTVYTVVLYAVGSVSGIRCEVLFSSWLSRYDMHDLSRVLGD